MRKLISVVLLMVVVLSYLGLVSDVKALTKVNDVITSDTTWTKANSPYTFTGSVLVGNGVTLTIEAGATINFNDYCHSIITNNTITVSGYAMSVHGNAQLPTIKYNNIYGNFYNLELVSSLNLDASYNWWGTTDQEAIARTIYDYKDNFNSGNVNFTPFLNESNPSAPTLPTDNPLPTNNATPPSTLTPTIAPSQTPSQIPTATPSQTSTIAPIEPGTQTLFSLNSMDVAILTVLIVVAVLLAVLLLLAIRKRR